MRWKGWPDTEADYLSKCTLRLSYKRKEIGSSFAGAKTEWKRGKKSCKEDVFTPNEDNWQTFCASVFFFSLFFTVCLRLLFLSLIKRNNLVISVICAGWCTAASGASLCYTALEKCDKTDDCSNGEDEKDCLYKQSQSASGMSVNGHGRGLGGLSQGCSFCCHGRTSLDFLILP